MSLWTAFAIMSLVALGFGVWPMYRQEKRLTGLIAAAIIGIVGLSAGLYYYQGQPEVSSGAAASPEMDDVIAALAERLAENPGDVAGWKMLGRSYMTLGNFPGAVEAFERAVELESGRDAQSLVALGEARLAGSGGSISGEVSALFESALAIDPNNPQALFYGGIGASNRNDQALAANRWERLLSLNPPAEIEGRLRQQIAEWRGEQVEDPEPPPQTIEQEGAVVSANLSISPGAAAVVPADAGVFIIARDPAQPSPPIAVTRRRVSELPTVVHLGDRESMVPGRSLSGFTEFELIARISMSGQPTQQSGDWFGKAVVRPDESNSVEISISEQVP